MLPEALAAVWEQEEQGLSEVVLKRPCAGLSKICEPQVWVQATELVTAVPAQASEAIILVAIIMAIALVTALATVPVTGLAIAPVNE